MRRSTIASFVLIPVALAACSKKAEQTPAQAASAAAAAIREIRPEPGRYRATTKFTNVSIPGMPPAAAARASKMFSQTGHSSEFCITPEQARMGYEEMTRRAAQGKCTYERFSAAGGKLDAAMTCDTGRGMTTKTQVSGTFTTTGSNMTMRAEASAPGMPGGGMHMEGTVLTERIGDCT
jgi:Protein of unknown function (DUF3617)